MSKNPSSFRASKLTVAQLTALVTKTGMTQTEIISVAIDRMFREEKMNTNYVDRQDKISNALAHLRELGFNAEDTEIIFNWFGSGTDEDQLNWLVEASKQEITEAAQPAFE